ncbi:permease [Mycobacterium sp.]|uniref:permease n=1 Tax=Mycobacterium sp. TaxID=1785 RepID=UPI002D613F5F|nr:permease [Mycobacterium sp.]HZA12315.1 permease [Mycobacterium sp.]
MTAAPTERRRRIGSMELLLAALVALALTGVLLSGVIAGRPSLSVAATVFCGVFVQALPFLVLGVLVSGLVAAFVTPERLARLLPRRTSAAIVVAGVGAAAVPGCECGSVPVARRLFDGAAGAAALTFMLAAPAINPVVLVATAVAFPGQPRMVLARFLGSLLTAVLMGAVWSRWGRADWVTRRLPALHPVDAPRWTVFTEAARHDFLTAAPYLVIGAAAAAALHVIVPPAVFTHLAGQAAVAIVLMAVLAAVLALCSEADAFVASSLTMLPLLPRLVFLVVGPAVDVKLFAMQAGIFGRRFAIRFAPTTFVVATVVATVVGALVLGGVR